MHGTRELQQCIQQCHECHRECVEVAEHCLHQGGEHATPERVFLLLDCAEICQTSANFLLRASELYPYTCAVCAQVCEQTKAACERFADSQQMRLCADACQRCADSCHYIAESSVTS